MTTALYLASAIFAALWLVAYVILPLCAPEGFEDEAGFHRGREPDQHHRHQRTDRNGRAAGVKFHSIHNGQNSPAAE